MDAPQLQHLFASGVRFDTEVQYLALGPLGLKYQNLPVGRSLTTADCTVISIAQCFAVLCQVPRGKVVELIRDTPLNDDDILSVVKAWLPAVTADVLESSDARAVGIAALQAIGSGHICIVLIETQSVSSWATVIGVESEVGSIQARALLLLDSSGSEPWCCAHNARIELQSAAGRQVRASTGFTLNCRHLTGEACAVRLQKLVTLKRAAPAR